MKVTVYKYERTNRGNGVVRILKDGVDIDEYVRKNKEKGISIMRIRNVSHNTLEKWAVDSCCEAVDGCTVEPDGICEHGFPSWLIALNLI